MKSFIRALIDLPTPLRAVFGVLLCTSLLGLVYMAFPSMMVLGVVVLGIMATVAVVMFYLLILRALKRRKDAPMAKGIVDNTAAAPTEVSAATHRARLDALSSTFSEGISKIRAAGKNLYAMPWYLLVGEPGSGKTEAIRRSQVGFPHGFQDELQGAGGTLNMDWWFTNDAVLLDTAGRLMFEDLKPGSTSEWHSFLKLLRKYRRNCPINGMLLAIPADSLISDSDAEVNRKAEKIAHQLEEIQRILGVRFPVSIMITKCDLINGFREYFDPLKDHQHQMIGWSNPAPLDQQFDPSKVDQHFAEIRDRMRQWRHRLLIDPVHTEDPAAKRIDQVDALFEFPEALMRLNAPLKRYLEAIFVPGNWSPDPLFLRGIYFTSSMREGEALDAILAEALCVPAESLPDGRGWERERAYFLKDLFLKKIFRESGLVTKAANTKRLLRRRAAGLIGAGFLAVLILASFTWFGRARLKASIGQHKHYWHQMAERYVGPNPVYWPIISEKEHRGSLDFYYRGGEPLSGYKDPITLGRFPSACLKKAAADMQIPWVFQFATSLSDLEGDRAAALGQLYNSIVLWPLTDAARRKMRYDGHSAAWSENATGALMYLVRIEAIAVSGADDLARDSEGRLLHLPPVFEYVLSNEPSDTTSFMQDVQSLQKTLAWLDEHRQDDRWPADSLEPLQEGAQAAIELGVSAFLKSWPNTAGGKDGRWAAVLSLSEGLSLFHNAEQRILAVDDGVDLAIDSNATHHHQSRLSQWRRAMGDLKRAKSLIDPSIERLASDLAASSIQTVYIEAETEAIVNSEVLFDELYSSMKLAASRGNETYRNLADQIDVERQRIKDEVVEKGRQASKLILNLENELLDRPTSSNHHSYAMRYRMYKLADDQLKLGDLDIDLMKLSEANSMVQGKIHAAINQIDDLSQQVPSQPIYFDAGAVCRFVLQQANHLHNTGLMRQVVTTTPNSYDELVDLVRSNASKLPTLHKPRLPMTSIAAGGQYSNEFHPEVGKKLSRALSLINDSEQLDAQGARNGNHTLNAQLEVAKGLLEEYCRNYWYYWSSRVRERDSVPGRAQDWSWSDFRDQLQGLEVFHVNKQLIKLSEQIHHALQAISIAPVSEEEHLRLLDTLDQELKQLRSGEFDRICKAANSLWVGLGNDEDAARRRLMGMTASDFADLYLEPYTESKHAIGVAYWNGIYYTALRSLASSAESAAAEALNKLIHEYKMFPILNAQQGDEVLNVSQIEEAYELSQKLLVLTDSGQAAGPDRTIDEGGQTKYPEINMQLRRLMGATLLKGDVGDWFKQVSMILQALATSKDTSKDVLNCEVRIISRSDQVEMPAEPGWGRNSVNKLRYIQVNTGQEMAPQRSNSDPVKKETINQFPVGDKDLNAVFFEHAKGDALGHLTCKGPWAAIRAINTEGTIYNSNSSYYRVPLLNVTNVKDQEDKEEQRYYYWIELAFDRPLPDLRHWPSKDTWPTQ